MNTGESEKKILQKHLARFLVEDVFNTVTEEDLLRIKRSGNPTQPDIWYHKGQELSPTVVTILKQNAKVFKDDKLWQILKAELLHWAHKKGYVEAVSTDDILAAKVMEYFVNVVDSKLRDMSR